MDESLVQLAKKFDCRVTRYADDVVFSGFRQFDPALRIELRERLALTPWQIADDKEHVQPIKGRIKIHGLLVQQDGVRLTKGYRNQVRAFAHVLATRGPDADNYQMLKGHVDYARHVQGITGSPTGISGVSASAIQAQKKHGFQKHEATRLGQNGMLGRLKRFVGL